MWWRWQQAEGRLHACDRTTTTPVPERPFPSLGGVEVTPAEGDFRLGGWPCPTCWSCDHEVRVREGFTPDDIPPLPDQSPAPRNPDRAPERACPTGRRRTPRLRR
ncbi:zinc finger protein [Saccharomonospora iraqiensis]|uniref:zinc finger protein n=1 Tax=Saccharomonospora iraqiensis TaxID=52698 RepID=UPI0009FFD55E|nr:zinc finger protein [Saccharomonospora iraqiensis]